jgi:acyl-coenzyme A synthetase/AMP-(fatty) acid ligase
LAPVLASIVMAFADESQPDWIALEHAGRQVTIRELSGCIRAAASSLIDSGAGVVAVCESDPIRHTVAVLGAVAAGRPALLVDARHPDSLLIDAVGLAGGSCCVGRSVPGVASIAFEELISGPPIVRTARAAGPEGRGTIFLTSGSTGSPKLVVRSRGADLHACMCLSLARFPIGPGDRHWIAVPHASAAFLTLVMGSLLQRATVVFAPFVRDDVDRFLTQERVSSVYLVPTMLRLAREHDGLRGSGWDALRALATGGERLDGDTAAILLDRFRLRVFCAYGMTECPRVAEATLQEVAERPGTVGRPIALRQVKIAPVDSDEAVDVGTEGEVLVRGPDLFSGYLGGPDAGEWHRTGDLGRVDEGGYLYVTGRGDAVVKVAGNRVSTEEIGAVLRSHPDLAQATVIAVEDGVWTSRLEAFAVVKPGRRVEGDEVIAWLTARLARYQIPRGVTFLDDLPTDSSGKVSLRTLHGLVMS